MPIDKPDRFDFAIHYRRGAEKIEDYQKAITRDLLNRQIKAWKEDGYSAEIITSIRIK
jgi:hypothetical protein